MKKLKTPKLKTEFVALLASGLVAGAAIAQDDAPLTFSGTLSAGAEYNSNVSVAELESASGQSDVAAIVDAGLDADWQVSDQLNINGGYSFSSQRYQDFDAFDLDMHMLFGDISYDFEAFTVGTSHYFADADLGGNEFLQLNQTSIYAGKLLSEQWYLRGAFNIVDKSFTGFEARDADTEGVSLDAFWFFNQGRSSLTFGYAYDDESTRDPAFAYQADTVRVRYSNAFSLFGKDSEVELGLRNQLRDYQANTPSIGAPRDDSQLFVDASLKMAVLPRLAVVGKIERGDFDSRLASANYSEERASLSLEYDF